MKFEAVGVTELHFGQWCTSAGIVDYVCNDASNITMLFCEVESTELRRSLVQASMGSWSGMLDTTLTVWHFWV